MHTAYVSENKILKHTFGVLTNSSQHKNVNIGILASFGFCSAIKFATLKYIPLVAIDVSFDIS